jgi:hypothetical protein
VSRWRREHWLQRPRSCLIWRPPGTEPVQLGLGLIRPLLTPPVTHFRPKPSVDRGHPVENEPPFPRRRPRCLPSSSSDSVPLAQAEARFRVTRFPEGSAPLGHHLFAARPHDRSARPTPLAEFSSEWVRPSGAR